MGKRFKIVLDLFVEDEDLLKYDGNIDDLLYDNSEDIPCSFMVEDVREIEN